jgi:ParB family transcriptional regulator, chromosome partitioning protein
MTKEICEVLLSDITIDETINVRSDSNSANFIENLNELAESIRTNELMQPIVLRGVQGQPPYDVVVGKRRFLAHRDILKQATIKAVFTGEIDDTKAIILSLSENMLRQEMNPMDIMRAVTRLYKALGHDVRQVQQRTGLSLKTVRNYIAIEAQATPQLLEMISRKEISVTNAKRVILTAQGDPEKINNLADPFKTMTKDEQRRAVEYASKNSSATVKTIIEQAQRQTVFETMILQLSRKVSAALTQAAMKLEVEKDFLVVDLLTEWLKNNDFLNE